MNHLFTSYICDMFCIHFPLEDKRLSDYCNIVFFKFFQKLEFQILFD
nr:MAG TPA: hypothetical protein [Caudoviricetes sp.]